MDNKVSSGTGWIKVDSRTICYGSGTSSTSTITLPKPYKNASYRVAACRGNASYEWVPTVDQKTTTTFRLRTCDKSNVFRNPSQVEWISVGRAG